MLLHIATVCIALGGGKGGTSANKSPSSELSVHRIWGVSLCVCFDSIRVRGFGLGCTRVKAQVGVFMAHTAHVSELGLGLLWLIYAACFLLFQDDSPM